MGMELASLGLNRFILNVHSERFNLTGKGPWAGKQGEGGHPAFLPPNLPHKGEVRGGAGYTDHKGIAR